MAEMLDSRSPAALLVVDALGEDPVWAVPEHFRIEVANAVRGLMLGRLITREAFEEALGNLSRAHIEVFPTVPLLPRIGELADNATPYDAAYIALAEQLDAPVVTTYAKLERIPGIRCEVRTLR